MEIDRNEETAVSIETETTEMTRNYILKDSQTVTALAWILVLTFGYGVLVGYSGKMLVGAGGNSTLKESHEGRFAQTARTL